MAKGYCNTNWNTNRCISSFLNRVLYRVLWCESWLQDAFLTLYRDGELDSREISVDVPEKGSNITPHMEGPAAAAVQEMFTKVDKIFSKTRPGHKRTMKVSEARPIIEEAEADKLISQEMVSCPLTHLDGCTQQHSYQAQ